MIEAFDVSASSVSGWSVDPVLGGGFSGGSHCQVPGPFGPESLVVMQVVVSGADHLEYMESY
ncbi:MAG TPA: hypothetical protein VIX85_06285 [Acidimicrobiales bacterium]